MSSKSDIVRLRFILQKIEDIEDFEKRYVGLDELLPDTLGYDATLMCLMQIGKTLNKIKEPDISAQLPVQGAYDVRNFIAPDYEGVDLALIHKIIRELLPRLQSDIRSILRAHSSVHDI